MASRLIVPFDYKPVSTTHYVAPSTAFNISYTVPAGRYAYVKDNLGGLSIDGIALIGYYRTLSASSTSSSVTQYNSPEFTGDISARVSVSYSGSASSSFARVYASTKLSTITSSTGGDSIVLDQLIANRTGSGSAIYASVSNCTFLSGQLQRITNGTVSFSISLFSGKWSGWVPSGTVLFGFDFTVTEYNDIS